MPLVEVLVFALIKAVIIFVLLECSVLFSITTELSCSSTEEYIWVCPPVCSEYLAVFLLVGY